MCLTNGVETSDISEVLKGQTMRIRIVGSVKAGVLSSFPTHVTVLHKAVDKHDRGTVGMDFDAPEPEPEHIASSIPKPVKASSRSMSEKYGAPHLLHAIRTAYRASGARSNPKTSLQVQDVATHAGLSLKETHELLDIHAKHLVDFEHRADLDQIRPKMGHEWHRMHGIVKDKN